jgi:NAD(P)-dependent dehydrogenase (short-subunit alcohol dehydrogenase family)
VESRSKWWIFVDAPAHSQFSSGIGRSVAILYAREGADVTIVHLPSEQPDADDTVKAIEHEGRKGLSIAFDLENFKHADEVIQKHMDTFGSLDILVNNASKQVMQPDFSKIDLDSVESVFRSNILQMFGITKFALPHMRKGASIINTTSVTTFKGSPAMVDYTSTKGAIVGFTRALAANLTPKGIVSHHTVSEEQLEYSRGGFSHDRSA